MQKKMVLIPACQNSVTLVNPLKISMEYSCEVSATKTLEGPKTNRLLLQGDVALVLINYSNDTTYQLSHTLGNARNVSDVLVEVPGDIYREEYRFTPGDGGKVHSKVSVLNGVELRPHDNGTLPELLPRVVRDEQEPLRLAPLSYAFVVMRGVNVTACHA